MKYIIILASCVLLFVGIAIRGSAIKNEYTQSYEKHWQLADKSSTLDVKKAKIGQFVASIEENRGDFADHSAVFFKNDGNSLTANLEALKTLLERLTQIEGMDPKSFEYNTAIQQITQQEQGEAHAMLRVIEWCWGLENHFFFYSALNIVVMIGLVLVFIVTIGIALTDY
jgi:maltodextrin utilization protein YvdJ